MPAIALSTVASVLLWSSPVAAQADTARDIRQPGRLGLGLGAGTRVWGLSAKLAMTEATAVQLVVGARDFGFGDGENYAASLDWLLERPLLFEDPSASIAWNFGAGPAAGRRTEDLGFNKKGVESWLGGAGVLGLSCLLGTAPVDFVLEYRPSFYVLPEFAIDLVAFGFHTRYFF